ncbi:hypothetical protein ACFFX0_21825 [Citricoccus parietis]|uniref:Uncharacterized protein n=1 Tax=Citricoccus parietis TaxID=592307 RepID=A0ABV5G425_9MICC
MAREIAGDFDALQVDADDGLPALAKDLGGDFADAGGGAGDDVGAGHGGGLSIREWVGRWWFHR